MSQLQYKPLEGPSFTVNIINRDLRSDTLVVEGSLSSADTQSGLKLVPRFNDKPMTTQTLRYETGDTKVLWYRFRIPASKDGVLRLFLESDHNNTNICLPLKFTRLSRIGDARRFDYRVMKNRLLIPQHRSLTFTNFSIRKIMKRETSFFIRSLRDNHLKQNLVKTLVIEVLRILTISRLKFNRQKIWLFSDRTISGGDNSEVLFRYVSKQHSAHIKPYFAINSDTAAYQKLKRDGYNIVKFRSIKHLYLTMIADLLLPSHMDPAYMYPWDGVWRKYNGLLQYALVHTQHGIVLNDISKYIGKRKKNAELFLSICDWEKRHLIESQYGYTAEETPVTGAPRYDELDAHSAKRIIAVHPTWRSWLVPENILGRRGHSKSFKQSDYFQFYQALLHDSKIVKALEKNDYILKFYLHPNHQANFSDFSTIDDRVRLMQFPYDYNAMFNESAILVTDFSNTLFDFAYLRKPIIHTQFDGEDFFSRQVVISEQVFNYETDGFGPVCKDYDDAINEIVAAIERGPTMSKKYKDRAEEFFSYSDKNNCKRAYEAILKFQDAR